jgi:hypothetical protein
LLFVLQQTAPDITGVDVKNTADIFKAENAVIIGFEKPLFGLAKTAFLVAIFGEAIPQVTIDGITQDCGYQSPFRRFGGPSLINMKIFVNAENVWLTKQPRFFLREAIIAVFTIWVSVSIEHKSPLPPPLHSSLQEALAALILGLASYAIRRATVALQLAYPP